MRSGWRSQTGRSLEPFIRDCAARPTLEAALRQALLDLPGDTPDGHARVLTLVVGRWLSVSLVEASVT